MKFSNFVNLNLKLNESIIIFIHFENNVVHKQLKQVYFRYPSDDRINE